MASTSSHHSLFCLALPIALSLPLLAQAADVKVNNAAELRAAVAAAKPGARLVLASGNYGAGFHFANLRGEEGRPIVIAAADPRQPPVFRDGNAGFHLSNPAYIELHNLVFTNLAHNGLNLDDGGVPTNASARGIVLRGLRISDVGSNGNHDGIKLSGLWDFRVIDCTIERWGTRGGSAIDMVGCHRGVIEGNTIRHNVPEPLNCSGVQGKGGTSDIVIRRNRFEHAGGRSVNIGGSTGLKYFRPPLGAPSDPSYPSDPATRGAGPYVEARNLRVEGNTFIGSAAPVAFVGVDGAIVRFNTIVFESARWSEGGVNIGSGTAPETFKFARNWWLCANNPDRSRPKLPTPEISGTYGRPITEARAQAGADALPK